MEVEGNGQNGAVLQGKVLRINPDGTIPEDNPVPGSAVYAIGVRDGRGLTVNPAGQVYITDGGEDASQVHDELNAVAPGGNLGWADESGPGGVQDEPLASWLPTVGIHGVAVYDESLFPDRIDDGIDNDHDKLGPDLKPGELQVDDNGMGECVGSFNVGGTCLPDGLACWPPRDGELRYCYIFDEMAEWCPAGNPNGDDACDDQGTAGVDELDESFLLNLFSAVDGGIQRAVLKGAGLED
jgi:hypothetical protein